MKFRKKCRICYGTLKKIISFNKISLVGDFSKRKTNKTKYPISLNFCKKCKHIQIAEIIKPEKLFSKYLWQTGVSKTNILLFDDLIKGYENKINSNTKVLEVASNDGSFLNYLDKKFNNFIVGIDPAKNLQKRNKNLIQIPGFFNFTESKKILEKFGKFDFIFARNVVAHVSNPNEIFSGIKNIIKNDGYAIIEVPHLLPILKNLQYDNVFHEHQGFHSIKSIYDLCKRNKLILSKVKMIKSQGGSIRCEVRKKNHLRIKRAKISKYIYNERKNGLFNQNYLKEYSLRILKHKTKLINLLKKIKLEGKRISIYGASGKGQALIQFCNIDEKLIDNIYDISKLKHNKFTPGTNLKILDSKRIRKEKKIDFLFLSSWNLKREIIQQEKKFKNRGGKFIIPFPTPRIIVK